VVDKQWLDGRRRSNGSFLRVEEVLRESVEFLHRSMVEVSDRWLNLSKLGMP
jgi:hypothetical protein